MITASNTSSMERKVGVCQTPNLEGEVQLMAQEYSRSYKNDPEKYKEIIDHINSLNIPSVLKLKRSKQMGLPNSYVSDGRRIRFYLTQYNSGNLNYTTDKNRKIKQ